MLIRCEVLAAVELSRSRTSTNEAKCPLNKLRVSNPFFGLIKTGSAHLTRFSVCFVHPFYSTMHPCVSVRMAVSSVIISTNVKVVLYE